MNAMIQETLVAAAVAVVCAGAIYPLVRARWLPRAIKLAALVGALGVLIWLSINVKSVHELTLYIGGWSGVLAGLYASSKVR